MTGFISIDSYSDEDKRAMAESLLVNPVIEGYGVLDEDMKTLWLRVYWSISD